MVFGEPQPVGVTVTAKLPLLPFPVLDVMVMVLPDLLRVRLLPT